MTDQATDELRTHLNQVIEILQPYRAIKWADQQTECYDSDPSIYRAPIGLRQVTVT